MRLVRGGLLGAVSLAAGALPALTFPAPALWWLAPVALVPWLLLLRAAAGGRRAVLVGWLGGTGFVLATHHWLAPSLHVFLVVLAALMGLLWAPWGLLTARLLSVRVLSGRPSAGALFAAAGLPASGWVAIELVRSWEYLGGPWALLGSSQWQVPPALRLMAWGGVWLVSWLLVAVNVCLTVLLAVPEHRRAAGALMLGAAVLVGGCWLWTPRPAPAGTARVAIVQPGPTPSAAARFDRGVELTRGLAGRDVDLVVWGESSVGYDLNARTDLAERLAVLSREVQAPLLVNVDARRVGGSGIYKSSVLVDGEGPADLRYDKMRLVPFGEYVPARALLGWATSVGPAAEEDRLRGEQPVVMETGGLRFGPLVCFETAFPDMSRHLAREDVRLLVAQSSTSTFQDGWAPSQHASLAALRAAETGRSVVHATLTGVSAVHGPRGEAVGERLGVEDRAARVYPVPLASGDTPYVRFGDWVVTASLGVLLGYAALALRRRPRARR